MPIDANTIICRRDRELRDRLRAAPDVQLAQRKVE